jgi:hypothetical protein
MVAPLLIDLNTGVEVHEAPSGMLQNPRLSVFEDPDGYLRPLDGLANIFRELSSKREAAGKMDDQHSG